MTRSTKIGTLFLTAPLALFLGIFSANLFSPVPAPGIIHKAPKSPSSLRETSSHFQSLELPKLENPNDCRAEIERLRNAADLHPMIRSALHDRALRAWLKLDASGALTFAESQGNDFRSLDNEGIRLFRVWFDLDPESALEAQKITSPALAKIVHPYLLKDLARTDPHRTLALLKKLKIDRTDKWQMGMAESEAYRSWAQNNPEEALQHFLGNSQLLSSGFLTASNLLDDWSSRDPEAAWEFYQAHKKHHYLKHSTSELAINLLQKDPSRLKEIEAKHALGIAQKWAQNDLQGALDFAESLERDDPWFHYFSVSAAKQLAISEPEKAIEMTLASLDGPEAYGSIMGKVFGNTHSILYAAFGSLHSTNPGRALELLQGLPEAHQSQALTGILNHEFRSNPEQAIQQTLKFRDDPHTNLALTSAVTALFSEPYAPKNVDLTPLIENFPEFRKSTFENPAILKTWVQASPKAAASFIKEEAFKFPDSQSGYQLAMGGALSELSTMRPEFTSQWIHELPPGDLQNGSARILAANWFKYDPAAALEWIENLPEGDLRAGAQSAFDRP